MMRLRLVMLLEVGGRRIWLPLPLLLLLAMLLEVLAFVPLILVALWRRDPLFWRIAVGFYLTRLCIALLLYGDRLSVQVGEDTFFFQIR